MNSLKYEMRSMFESRNAMDLFGRDSGRLEDGLLESILNLSILNPYAFDSQPWSILAVKSYNAKNKLYILSQRQQVFIDSAVTLIILRDSDGTQMSQYGDDDNIKARLKLLSMSIMYSSKYYGVDSYMTTNIDLKGVRDYFDIDEKKQIEMLVCLGYFDSPHLLDSRDKCRSYSNVVREV